MNKQERNGAFFNDITIEEVHLFLNYFESQPNGERVHRVILTWLGEKVFELAEQGEVLSCYTDDTEHALHPDGFTWADSSHPVVPLQRQPNQVVTPVERAS